jgi:hypothetical protein
MAADCGSYLNALAGRCIDDEPGGSVMLRNTEYMEGVGMRDRDNCVKHNGAIVVTRRHRLVSCERGKKASKEI